jgi:hypothetical protein
MAAAAGAPPPSLSDDDDLDYGTLPPKSLERLFGIDIVVRNPDEPACAILAWVTLVTYDLAALLPVGEVGGGATGLLLVAKAARTQPRVCMRAAVGALAKRDLEEGGGDESADGRAGCSTATPRGQQGRSFTVSGSSLGSDEAASRQAARIGDAVSPDGVDVAGASSDTPDTPPQIAVACCFCMAMPFVSITYMFALVGVFEKRIELRLLPPLICLGVLPVLLIWQRLRERMLTCVDATNTCFSCAEYVDCVGSLIIGTACCVAGVLYWVANANQSWGAFEVAVWSASALFFLANVWTSFVPVRARLYLPMPTTERRAYEDEFDVIDD